MHRTAARLALASLAGVLCACQAVSAPPSPRPSGPDAGNPIQRENRLRGDTDWYRRPTAPGIAGYATATSVGRGGSLGIAVSTVSPTFAIDVFRIGWYNGAGARLVGSVRDLPGTDHGQWRPGTFGVTNCPTCTYDTDTGLLELHWPISYTLSVPAGWTSGNFVARLTTSQGAAAYVPFIVTDLRRSAVLAVMPVNTYAAYNMWGGKSMYTNSLGPPTLGVGANAPSALKVSFERPLAGYEGYVKVDYATVSFLESEGYDVTYATSVDLDRDHDLDIAHRVLVSVGHDEYWSSAMRETVQSGRDRGLDVAFLSGNDVYWQVRYEPGPDGDDHGVLICYRAASIDPESAVDPALTTVRWIDRPVSHAQDALTGSLYTGRVLSAPASWVLGPGAPAWLLAGTGLEPGSTIPGLVGVECDSAVTASSHPEGWQSSAAPPGLVIVSDSPVVTVAGAALFCNTVDYRVPGGGEVFSAGTWSWQDFLTGPSTNASVVRMTENLFARFGVGARA
jgi:hypothetical protein